MKVGPKSSLRPFLHRALQILNFIYIKRLVQTLWLQHGPYFAYHLS